MLLCHNLADSVKSAQRERGLNNQEMARSAGVSRTTLSGLLRGEGNPRLSTVERIAKKLELDPVRLMCWARDDAEREWFEQTLEMIDKAGALTPEKRERFMELLRALVQSETDKD